MKKVILTIIILALLVGGYAYVQTKGNISSIIEKAKNLQPVNKTTGCPDDTLVCADGTKLKRQPPLCNFPRCSDEKPNTADVFCKVKSDCFEADGREKKLPGQTCSVPCFMECVNFRCTLVHPPNLDCLSAETSIRTQDGDRLVTDLHEGDLVWTVDRGSTRLRPILEIAKTAVSKSHKVSHLVLSDGRELYVSPGHPAVNGKTVGKLTVGEKYDGSTVIKNDPVPYNYSYTYDILPAGDTGFYWANGILVGSTLH